jgi:hypothetical protein
VFSGEMSRAPLDCVLCYCDTIALKTPKSREKDDSRRYFDYCGITTTEYKWTTKEGNYAKIQQALEFVKNDILSKDGNITEMELFIEDKVFDKFSIPKSKTNSIGKAFRNEYAQILKVKRKTQSKKELVIAYNEVAYTGDNTQQSQIDPKYDGLYSRVIDPETQVAKITPYQSKIAEYVVKK